MTDAELFDRFVTMNGMGTRFEPKGRKTFEHWDTNTLPTRCSKAGSRQSAAKPVSSHGDLYARAITGGQR